MEGIRGERERKKQNEGERRNEGERHKPPYSDQTNHLCSFLAAWLQYLTKKLARKPGKIDKAAGETRGQEGERETGRRETKGKEREREREDKHTVCIVPW